MGKTRKDKPLWVGAKLIPWHRFCEHDIRFKGATRECDLPKVPVAAPRLAWQKGCCWEVEFPPRYLTRRRWQPPKWHKDHLGNNRHRTRLRSETRKMLAEHRSNGKVDTVAPPVHNKHNAIAYWF